MKSIQIPADVLNAAMQEAISAAAGARRPFGATLLDTKTESMRTCANTTRESGSRFAHAEMNVLQMAFADSWELSDHVLVSTAEPCTMCAAAATISGVKAIIFGTSADTLVELGFFQIRIKAADVAVASTHPNPPAVHGGFLAHETDRLYREFCLTNKP